MKTTLIILLLFICSMCYCQSIELKSNSIYKKTIDNKTITFKLSGIKDSINTDSINLIISRSILATKLLFDESININLLEKQSSITYLEYNNSYMVHFFISIVNNLNETIYFTILYNDKSKKASKVLQDIKS